MSTQEVGDQPRRRRRRPATQTVFALVNAHAKSEYRKIHKDKLVIPVEDYQRDESMGVISNAIAQNFDVVAFGTLAVIHSADNTLRVLDGGTRLSGARKRADIIDVPCQVFSGLTLVEEAEAFLRINENRRRLQVAQLQHAEVTAQRSLALTTEEYIQRLHDARVGFNSLAVLRRTIKGKPAATATVIEVLVQAAMDHYVSARVLTGIVTLEFMLNKKARTLRTKDYTARVQKHFHQLDNAVSVATTTHQRTDSKTLAHAVAKTLKLSPRLLKD